VSLAGSLPCDDTVLLRSKAAALNLTQSLRALLADQGVAVHAVVIGPIDTDMNRGLEIPKAAPEQRQPASSMV